MPVLEAQNVTKVFGSGMLTKGRTVAVDEISLTINEEKPTVIAEENKPGSDGKKGRMSLCAKCTVIFLDKMGVGFATITPIKEEKEGEDG